MYQLPYDTLLKRKRVSPKKIILQGTSQQLEETRKRRNLWLNSPGKTKHSVAAMHKCQKFKLLKTRGNLPSTVKSMKKIEYARFLEYAGIITVSDLTKKELRI